MKPFAVFLQVWLAISISIVTIFGLFKLGGYMFHLEVTDSPSITEQNVAECWKAGGTPVMDTDGDYDDFKECKKGEQ